MHSCCLGGARCAVQLCRVQEMEAVQGQAKASYAAGDHAPQWMTIACTSTLYSLRLWMKDQLDRDAAYILSPQRSLVDSCMHACMHGSSMLGFATWSDEDMIGRASWLRWLHTLMCPGLPRKPAVSPVWHCSEDTAALPWSVQTFVATQGMDPAIEKGALIHFCSCMVSTPHTCHADVRSCHAQVMSCRVMS